ncbi:MAG: isoleucine--tRNA ligase [Candidatus Omnitrophica bacterium CG1_02_44_16]|nr:MAG: isoleucine--tRNA ligase [Candidatus Omnitrophica bacterium CG1_02_44_16]
MEYKHTLNLPKTDFSMKANLNLREPEMLGLWQKTGLYQKLRSFAHGRDLFILHDGPPYANGRIHIGHALNKILKDIIVRYKTMRGFDAPYIPGWDCHGLPVEHQLFKDLKKTKDQIGRVTFRKLAADYAMKYVDIQKEEFKRLGLIGDWDHPYLTLDKSYEEAILVSFASLVEKGFVYRGLKPVNWCYRCETALAEAEVEYAPHESDSVFVNFEIKSDAKSKQIGLPLGGKLFIIIWTTTPWTLLANVAVAVHPSLEYIVVSHKGGSFIIGKSLFNISLRKKLGFDEYKIVLQVKGSDLEGLVYCHPFGLREGKVVLADYVSKEDGTGCVHTAPGHGQEDFMTGAKYGLEVIMPVDEKGRFDQSVGEFSGQHVIKANENIINKLNSLGVLRLASKFEHTYPHCWRCKSPVIFRATQQWFLKIDENDLRNRLLKIIKNDIKWIPPSGEERISSMVENRPDWCISRQRYWGVPIPAVICKKCQHQILDVRVIRNLAKRVLTEGTDAWFTDDIKDFLPIGMKCECGCIDFERSTDILDVWFDSGVSHQAVLKGNKDLKLPADLYLEGSDQHRGWFQASLILSMVIDNRPPYISVLTHGFVVDSQGRKMSKSLGNVIAPQEIIKDYGADILRLWVLSSDYNEDVRISKEILAFTADAYRKIRNTARFLLGNLCEFDPAADGVRREEMPEIDRWAMFRLSKLIEDVTQGYETYKFYHVFQRLFTFCNEEMSSLYLDILKDRLYTAGKRSILRRSAQTCLYEIVSALAKLLAPVCPFTADEIYKFMAKGKDDPCESVILSSWPKMRRDLEVSGSDVSDIGQVLSLRPLILKALEEKRAKGEIGSSLEAKAILGIKDEAIYKIFLRFASELPFIFIVSQAEVVKIERSQEAVEVAVLAADGKKCSRCWNYSPNVGLIKDHPEICGRCAQAING